LEHPKGRYKTMNKTMAYAIGMLTLALSMGCAKRCPSHSVSEKSVETLASWTPEEAEWFMVASSMEELKASLEKVKQLSFMERFKKGLEGFQEEGKEHTGLDWFSLATWQEMGINVQAPLSFSGQKEDFVALLALPVLKPDALLAAIEKNFIGEDKWEVQPNMPAGLYGWHHAGTFVVLEQKPGYALFWIGDELEALQKRTQLPADKSWAKHTEVLLKMASRFPAGRVVSTWFHIQDETSPVEWIGAGLTLQPSAKMVGNVLSRQGQEAVIPAMQMLPFVEKQWTQGLGGATVSFWSSVRWDWYTQLLNPFASVFGLQLTGNEEVETMKGDLESPFLGRAWLKTTTDEGEAKEDFKKTMDEGDEDFKKPINEEDAKLNVLWSVDFLLTEGAENAVSLLASLLSAEKVEADKVKTDKVAADKVEANKASSAAPVWQAQLRRENFQFQAVGPNKVRIAKDMQVYEGEVPSAMEKMMLQKMQRFPVAMAIHLNAFAQDREFRELLFGEEMKQTEYILVGMEANAEYAQWVVEHITESAPR